MANFLGTAIYQPLGNVEAVRLLKFLASDGPCMRANLVEVSLNDPHLVPFMTVSYTWGSTYSDEPFMLNGRKVPILQSVAPLLRMLNSNKCPDFDSRHDYLWVDSICIDQKNHGERAAQVKLMNKIYTQASQTLVWLGEQSHDTDQAIDLLITLGQRRREFRLAAKKGAKRVPVDLKRHPGWDSLDRFLQNPWWRRVWTLQEFLIPGPDTLRFYCGGKSLSRQAFRHGIDALDLCMPMKTSAQSAWNRRRISDWYHRDESRSRMSLISMMAFCGDYEVTDHRDRVWGLHGLAREEDRKMIGNPTYAYDLETLYTGLVRSFVEAYQSLDIICFSHIFTSVQPDWPSWVPDWQVPVHQPLLVPLMVSQSASEHLANFRPISTGAKRKDKASYSASGNEGPRTNWDVFRRLECQGIVIDVIDGLCSAQRGTTPTVESTSSVNTRPPNEQERISLLSSLTRSLVLDRIDRFLEQRTSKGDQYAMELVQLVEACRDLKRPDSTVPAWFFWWWHNRQSNALRIRGFTLDQICTSYQQDFNVSQHALTAPKRFFTRLRHTMAGGNRRLLVTELGHIGLGPKRAEKGDLVCVLFGCSVPVVLRRFERPELSEQNARTFQFVGECYIDGFMDGEALALGRPVQDFTML